MVSTSSSKQAARVAALARSIARIAVIAAAVAVATAAAAVLTGATFRMRRFPNANITVVGAVSASIRTKNSLKEST